MHAVIYARYSTELQRDASIEDRVRLCRERIAREGWQLLQTYTDRGRSGASRLRPAYQTLREDARAGRFEVLLAEALDRLSRDQEDTAALYKQLAFAGVKIVTLAEGEINEMHVGLKGTMNALFLKDLAAKTHRGLRGRIAAGRSAGGNAFGYAVVRELDAAGTPVRGARRIDAAQAAVVRRIFRAYAAGHSTQAIAKALNAEGVPGPSGRPWGASTIHGNWRRGTGILNNELYIGRLVWNRQRFMKDPKTGKRVARPNPEHDWIVEAVPHLQILDPDLWEAVKTRQRHDQERVRAGRTGLALNAAHRRRFLLSGRLSCGVCGGGYTIVAADRYGCANHRNRGTCANTLTIRRAALKGRVLAGLKDRLLAPELVKTFVAEFHAELNHRSQAAELAWTASRQELTEVDRKIAAMLTAIESGVVTASTKDRLLALERRKAELERLRPVAPAPRLHPNLAEVYRQKVARLEEALNAAETRTEAAEALRALIEEIRLTPDESGTLLAIELYGELGAILALAEARHAKRPGAGAPGRGDAVSLVAGAGFEPATFRL